ncbi:hypothetical protein ACN28E_55005 [Archangium lansingense]|uniref:hypothetical protein n=1 Tax=Archangium lansingense TaxID=2995310 RepID=UPI003B7D6176
MARYEGQLVALVLVAQAEGVEVRAWVGAALRQVAADLPGGAEALVEQRPGSWEADLVYQLLTECADSAARAHQGSRAEFSLVRRLVYGTIS